MYSSVATRSGVHVSVVHNINISLYALVPAIRSAGNVGGVFNDVHNINIPVQHPSPFISDGITGGFVNIVQLLNIIR